MKVRAIIQARMMSKRLRGKSLMSVNDVPLLFRVINSVKEHLFIDEITIATTEMIADDPIVAAVENMGVSIYRGDSLNVLNRFVKATDDMDEQDIIVRFTADNPISITDITKLVFQKHLSSKSDYTHIQGLSHLVPEIIKVGALREVNQLTRENFDKEHVTPYFRKNLDLFRVIELPNSFEGLRSDLDHMLTIDTDEQLVSIESMFNAINYNVRNTNLDDIYRYLDKINHTPEHKKLAINLNGTPVGEEYPTYVIAEIGQNHNGEIEMAKRLIDMAISCGASAVKFQKRDIPSELTKEAYDRPYKNSNSFGNTYGEHRIFLELDEKQHMELKEYSSARGITYFCTPCDIPSVELLERINCPFYKVASRDLTNLPLLQALGKTGKPIIISTGMADYNDIDNGIEALGLGSDKLMILQCTSQYPCSMENVNLKVMETLKSKYGLITGFSDHTSGIVVSTAASVLGASIIEKHITLDRTMKGTDQPSSLERSGLSKLIDYIRACEIALGDGVKVINPVTETAKLKLARSITSKTLIQQGDILTKEMICLKSPGDGIKWVDNKLIVGKMAVRDIEPDVTLFEDDFN